MSKDAPGAASAELTLHEDQLQVETERVSTHRVVLRRRIVTEVRQVEVTVRREELEVERRPLPGQPDTATAASSEPIVIVLSEEVPVVQLRTRPYEQVTVSVSTVAGKQDIAVTLDREEAEIRTETPP